MNLFDYWLIWSASVCAFSAVGLILIFYNFDYEDENGNPEFCWKGVSNGVIFTQFMFQFWFWAIYGIYHLLIYLRVFLR